MLALGSAKALYLDALGIRLDGPRLSAAITTPSLNLTATTDVPVTIGCCVCCFGPEVCKYDESYAP